MDTDAKKSTGSGMRRERRMVMAGLAGAVVVAWVYLFTMDMAEMGGMAMAAIEPWSATDFAAMFAMWSVMMVGMMLPSATPTILLYAALARSQMAKGNVIAPAWIFTAGYMVAWTLYSAGATVLQWGLEQLALLSPMMVSTSAVLGGVLLVGAGIYQWTPAKHACLDHCRSPIQFLATHHRPGKSGAMIMGMHHGAFCVGCCWSLMLLLFVGGVMNLLWVAAIAAFVLAEKLFPRGDLIARASGVIMVAAGAWMLFVSLTAAG